ncbi:MAG: hypothetical protein QF681_13210 [Vicinamibacterales bacterium]|jgi:hypothetical protein|nr:hypothetical protein [Vicinamibacterales bacterium]
MSSLQRRGKLQLHILRALAEFEREPGVVYRGVVEFDEALDLPEAGTD